MNNERKQYFHTYLNKIKIIKDLASCIFQPLREVPPDYLKVTLPKFINTSHFFSTITLINKLITKYKSIHK